MKKRSLTAKTLSVVLSILMLLGACPIFGVIASAATPTKISSISLEIDKPRPGLTPDYTATYDVHCQKTTRFDEADKMINGVSWRYQKVNTSTTLKKTDTFTKGVQYTFSIVVQVKDGYVFDAADNYSSNVAAYVNGKRATVVAIHGDGYNAKNVLVINYTFDACDYFTINSVKLYDVKLPKMGEQVSFNVTPASTDYTVSTVTWHDDTANKTLAAGDVFQANHNYTLEVFVRAAAGCRLKTDADDGPDFTAKINNVEAELIYAATNGGVAAGIRMTYSTDSVIRKISVSDIEIPKAGNHADYTCVIDGVGYELDTYGIDWTKNGGWGSALPIAETFQAGQSYELKIWLKAKDGYSFMVNWLDEVIAEAEINGEAAEVYLNATDKDCQIIIVYDVPADIKAVDITGITEPFAGGSADMTAEASSPDYEVTDVAWKDTTGEYKDYIYNITSFTEGREYTVDITVIPTGNNSFRPDPDYDIPDITAKINGKNAGVYSEGGRDKATIYYRFRTPVEIVTVTGLDEPVADKTPDMTAESTKAGYTIHKVEWYDDSATPAAKLSATDKFIAGHNYTVQITLYAVNDFAFNVEGGYQEITATINGKDAIEYGSHEYGTAVIGYKFSVPAPHTHTPSAWKTDAANHWKVCTDSTCGEITSAKEAHKDTDGNEKCDKCAYPMPKPLTPELLLKSGSAYKADHTAKTVKVTAKDTVAVAKQNILNEKYAILTSDKKAADSKTVMGTGMIVQILAKDSSVLREYKVIVPCDVDGNGEIQATDARLALRASVNLEKVEGVYKTAADTDGDGSINASDARTILRRSVGLS